MMRASFNHLAGAALLVSALNSDPTCAADMQPTAGAAPVLVVVKVARPWYTPNFVIRSRMRDTIPNYAALPGLTFKYFSIADDGAFGGIYLWHDALAAQAWFTPAWFANVEQSRGSPANVRTFDVTSVEDTVPGGVQREDHSDSVAVREREQVAERFDRLVRMGDAAAVFRAHPAFEAPDTMIGAIRAVLHDAGYWQR